MEKQKRKRLEIPGDIPCQAGQAQIYPRSGEPPVEEGITAADMNYVFYKFKQSRNIEIHKLGIFEKNLLKKNRGE